VIAQAGSSEAGRELAARTADVVFTAQTKIDEARPSTPTSRAAPRRYGRGPDDIKIMPGLTPAWGARWKRRARTTSTAVADARRRGTDVAIAHLGRARPAKYPLDGPLPELPPSNAAKARQALIVQAARENNMTLRQIARHTAAGTGHRVLVGTPQYMADEMEAWLKEEAADGFNVVCNHYPKPFEDFCHLVVPSCSGAASSVPSTKARPCVRIWAYAFRKTDTPARCRTSWPRRRHEETHFCGSRARM